MRRNNSSFSQMMASNNMFTCLLSKFSGYTDSSNTKCNYIKSEVVVPWSELPSDLVEKIAKLLEINLSDYVRFRAVCKPWRAFTPDLCEFPAPPHLPWIMLSSYYHKKFYTIHKLLVPYKNNRLSVPYTVARFFKGKLYINKNNDLAAKLRNPLTMSPIYLPSLKAITKIILLVDGTALAYCRGIHGLAFLRPGDVDWVIMEFFKYTDILPYQGGIYVIDRDGVLAQINIGSEDIFTPIAVAPVGSNKFNWWYLVEYSPRDLLLVARYMQKPDNKTTKFEVFKLDDDNRLVELKSLGDRVLFLGENRSLCLSARDCTGWKGNRIYFTDCFHWFYNNDCKHNCLGAFSMEDGNIESVSCYPDKSKVTWSSPMSVWYMPHLCKKLPGQNYLNNLMYKYSFFGWKMVRNFK